MPDPGEVHASSAHVARRFKRAFGETPPLPGGRVSPTYRTIAQA